MGVERGGSAAGRGRGIGVRAFESGERLAPRWQQTIGGEWELVGGGGKVEESDHWQTPDHLVDMLVRTFIGPDGYLDPCGGPGSAMTNRAAVAFVPPLADAFDPEIRWPPIPVLANVPWSQTGRWVRLLLEKAKGGIALIAPLRLDTVWVREFAPSVVLVPPSRFKYVDPVTREIDGSPRTSSCIYLRGVGPFSKGARNQRTLFADAGWREWRVSPP